MGPFEEIVRKSLEDGGCLFVKWGKGSYEVWLNPVSGKYFPVDASIKSRRNANVILKLAGVNKEV
ncbi:MAG: type II toxin-antitoxin system HicA family toxin [Oscillospiraceae bacterium]|nr:type II toxin-antitoxin system HicA family toxin [Oscillospiraceae bacterium]